MVNKKLKAYHYTIMVIAIIIGALEDKFRNIENKS